MKKIQFKQLEEELYFEKLANGLDVYILRKHDLIKHLLRLQQNMDLLIITLSH